MYTISIHTYTHIQTNTASLGNGAGCGEGICTEQFAIMGAVSISVRLSPWLAGAVARESAEARGRAKQTERCGGACEGRRISEEDQFVMQG